MSLAIALNNALSGLSVNQQSLAVLSQNIANANTPNYSRQIVNQAANYLSGIGNGVSIEEVSRRVDDYLNKSVRQQTGVVSRSTVAVDYADRVQLLLGQPGSQNSVTNYITTFFSSLHGLAQTPESTTQRVNVVNAAVTLTRNMQQLSQGLQELRFQAEQEIDQAFDAVNNTLRNLKEINVAISTEKVLGHSTVGLEDKRDALLKEVGEYIDVQTFKKEDGQIHLITAGGVSLLDDSLYQFKYNPATSLAAFENNISLAPATLVRIDTAGNETGQPVTVVTGGAGTAVSSIFTTGKIKGLLELRDRQLPNQVAQLDLLAATIREEVNKVHNAGISYPGVQSMTGSRALSADSFSAWEGQIRIAVLDSLGQPVPSQYADETSGARPLLLDLSTLDTGNGAGYPSLQGIVDEINNYFNPPQNKVELGNLNNIRLASDTTQLPGVPPGFRFDLDVENISGSAANIFITDIQVFDNTNTNITSLNADVPRVSIDGGYITTFDSPVVTLNTTAPHGFVEGQTVYLSEPNMDIDGIPAAELGGYFTITNVTSNSFRITAQTGAATGDTIGAAAQVATASYDEIQSGEYRRTKESGIIDLDLSLNSTSSYYLVRMNVGVEDAEGNISTSEITYRVDNSQANLLNRRYAAQSATGDATVVPPSTSQSLARAMLVDANGVELPKVNGKYTTTQQGYLKIATTNSNHVLALDSLNSVEKGRPNDSPPIAGTERGFSYYFEMNNFFKSYNTGSGSSAGSARNLAIEDRLLNNPNLIALGSLQQSAAPIDSSLAPLYTYERHVGDNSVIQRLASLSSALFSYSAVGGLGATTQTFDGFAGQIIGAAAANASNVAKDQENAQLLLDGYSQRSDSISGVNLDEELANTIIYQNSYTASARVISVTNDLFDVLIQSF